MENENFEQFKKVESVIYRIYDLNYYYRETMRTLKTLEYSTKSSGGCKELDEKRVRIEEKVTKLLKIKVRGGKTVRGIITEMGNVEGQYRSVEERRKIFVAVPGELKKLDKEVQSLGVKYKKLLNLEIINE